MRIRNKLILGFCSMALLVTAVGGLAIKLQHDRIQKDSILEAKNVAKTIATFISLEMEKESISPEHAAKIQEYTMALHAIRKRDIEVVGVNGKILADIFPKHIGKVFKDDQNGEVAQTIADNVTRTFIEQSADYPEGIRQIVVPVQNSQGKTVAAVILEYTPLYDELLASVQATINLIVAVSGAALLLSALLGIFMSRSIVSPIFQLKNALVKFEHGERAVRVSNTSNDEIGEFAISFNQMADQISELVEGLERSRSKLEYALVNLNAIVDNLVDGLLVLDPNGLVIRSNPSFLKMLGLGTEKNLSGQHVQEIFSPEIAKQLLSSIRHSGESQTKEIELAHQHIGQALITQVNTEPSPGHEQRLLGSVLLIRDITAERDSDRLKNDFTAVVSHELRTPLSSIYGSIKLLSTGKPEKFSGQAQELLNIALRNTERLNRLVNDVLDLERIASGNVVISKQRCGVTDLLTQATQEMQSMAAAEQVTLTLKPFDHDVYADPDQIMQTLTNLLSNAIKFSSAQDLVSLSAMEKGDNILFEVKDQGRGIPHDKLEKIFERFQQVDTSDGRLKGGTGLGLPICRQIVKRHGGQIWAESIEGQGSSLYFTLPIFKSGQ